MTVTNMIIAFTVIVMISSIVLISLLLGDGVIVAVERISLSGEVCVSSGKGPWYLQS